jgi:hypothetical protein
MGSRGRQTTTDETPRAACVRFRNRLPRFSRAIFLYTRPGRGGRRFPVSHPLFPIVRVPRLLATTTTDGRDDSDDDDEAHGQRACIIWLAHSPPPQRL